PSPTTLLPLFSLLLHAPPPPRHLPSFPTRRSSDLVFNLCAITKLVLPAITASIAFWIFSSVTVSTFDVASSKIRNGGLVNIVLADRKSTRLNSSHVSISYAVFCLKKKNI